MDASEKLEAMMRLSLVMAAHENGQDATVVEQGEAYLAQPDAHLDLVTARPNVHALVAEAYDRLEWPALASEHHDRALLGETHLELVDVGWFRFSAALARLKTGRYDGLTELLRSSLERAVEAPLRAALLRLGAVERWRRTGDLGSATDLLEQAAVAAGRPPGAGLWWHDAVLRGQLLLEAERVGEAVAVLVFGVDRQRAEGGSRLEHDTAVRTDLAIALAEAARACVRADRAAEARALLVEADQLVDRRRTYAHVNNLLAHVEVAGAAGDLQEAERCFAGALQLIQERELRPTEVTAWEALARARAADGDRAAAQEALGRGIELARALQHVNDLWRLGELLHALA